MLDAIFQKLIEGIIKVQNSQSEYPEEPKSLPYDWEFIFANINDWIVLSCVTRNLLNGYWIYPMLYPKDMHSLLKEELPEFDIRAPSVAYSHVMSGSEHWIEPWWEDAEGYKKVGCPLFFQRHYYGYPEGDENYYDFNQIVTHPLDLHWSARLHSYCKTDDFGEEIEKKKIIEHDDVSLILARKKTVEKLLHLGDWVLTRYCVFTRLFAENPKYSSYTEKRYESKTYEAKYKIVRFQDEYIEFRGAQIYQPVTPKEQLLSWDSYGDDEETEKRYAPFIVQDRKNDKILKDYSIEPGNFANYFTKSELPWEVSPIFFKAEVLDKYKSNPDKYELKERSISCRGGWFLKTYDINEHNQVHTYAVYLSNLPYKEQLHWAQYNEEPKGPISKRAHRTDIEGRFVKEKSNLQQLKGALEQLGDTKVGPDNLIVWAPKGGSWESASKGLYFVNSENPNLWHDFIIALCNVTNEGFKKKQLKKVAAYYGVENEGLGTLGLIKHILIASDNNDKLKDIHGILSELQIRRGKGKAHGTWHTPEGSLIDDASKQLLNVIAAIEDLIQILKSLKLEK